MFDIVIKNARIIDGTGAPWFTGDVGVTAGRITSMGFFPENVAAKRVIQAQGRYLMPGFVDTHTHSDFELLRDPGLNYKLYQGVTTLAIGQCGYSAAPVIDENLHALDQYVGFIKAGVEPDWTWRSFGQWLDHIATLSPGVNIASFAGHGTIRIATMGFKNRPVTQKDIDNMTAMVRQCREQGAAGLTSGLIYPPGIWATAKELTAVTSGLCASRGTYESHMRNEAKGLLASVRETIQVGRDNDIPVQISHHKACGKENWGLIEKTLKLIEDARKSGVDVVANQYPYDISSTTLRSILPAWVQEGGLDALIKRLKDRDIRKQITAEINGNDSDDWENMFLNSGRADGVMLLFFPKTPQYEGKTLGQAAHILGKDPLEMAYDLMIDNPGEDTCGFAVMSEKDVRMAMQHPAVFIASDSIPAAPGAKVHPRAYSTFPRVLDKYVKQEKILSLEEAVRKMSSFPAQRLGLAQKGVIKKNMDADMVLIDMNAICDNASFESPYEKPGGIDMVMVNGQIAVENAMSCDAKAGKVLYCV
jgi:N-acyl-D-amino-acid deacylase